MKSWEDQQRQKHHQNKLSSAKLQSNKNKTQKFTNSDKVGDYFEYEKKNLQKIPLYKILKLFKMQQYAKELISRGFGYDIEKFKTLNSKQIDELIKDIKAYPGHQAKLIALFEYIHQLFPDFDNIPTQQSNNTQKNTENSFENKKSEKKLSKVEINQNPYVNKYKQKKQVKQLEKKENPPKQNIKQSKIGFNYFRKSEDDYDEFNQALEDILDKYQSQSKFFDPKTSERNNEQMLMKISQAEIKYNKEPVQSVGFQTKKNFDLKKKEKDDNLKEIKENMTQAKQMYQSFEGGKMTSTLVNIDLEEMCFCLSLAVLVHIDNGDYFYEQSYQQHEEEEDQYDYDEFDSSSEESEINQPNQNILHTISEKTFENTNEQYEDMDFEESRQELEQIIRESLVMKNENIEYQEESDQNYQSDFCENKQLKNQFYRIFNEKSQDPLLLQKPPNQIIQNFCKNIIITGKMEKEAVIICLIYLERLVVKDDFQITSFNWRLVILICLILANKIWDDESFENENFSQAYPQFSTKDINNLECCFLKIIDYDLYIKSSEYAKYYYILRSFSEKSKKSFPLKPLDLQTILKLQKQSYNQNNVIKAYYQNPLNKSIV